MLQHFSKTKEILGVNISRLEQLAREFHGEIALELNKMKTKLADNVFNLVVLGQFKKGKTTFINALLGKDLLPTAVVPLTSIVTIISYGQSVKITVLYKDNHTENIPLEQLANYITEAKNPNNIKKVKEVHIAFPSPYLKDGVKLIDTPGVGSIYQNNTDETYSYIPKVDAAIFLLSVDPPISQAECDFLADIREYAAKIFFILNKIDYLSPEERKQSLDFSRQVIETKAGLTNITIYPLSARLASEAKTSDDEEKLARSMLPKFEMALSEFLLREKGKTLLLSAINNGLKAGQHLQSLIELEKRALGMTAKELADKIKAFDRQMEHISQEQADTAYILKGETTKLMENLEKSLTHFREKQTDRFIKVLEDLIDNHPNLGNKALSDIVDRQLALLVEQVFEERRPEQNRVMGEAFEKITGRFVAKANQMIEYIAKISKNIFDIRVETFKEIEKLTEKSDFYYMLEDSDTMFMVDPSKLTYLLPKYIFRNRLKSTLRKKTWDQLDRNCGRIRYDFSQRVDKSLRSFKSELNAKIQSVLNGISKTTLKALEMKKASNEEVAAKLDILKKQETVIVEIISNLSGMQGKIKNW